MFIKNIFKRNHRFLEKLVVPSKQLGQVLMQNLTTSDFCIVVTVIILYTYTKGNSFLDSLFTWHLICPKCSANNLIIGVNYTVQYFTIDLMLWLSDFIHKVVTVIIPNKNFFKGN